MCSSHWRPALPLKNTNLYPPIKHTHFLSVLFKCWNTSITNCCFSSFVSPDRRGWNLFHDSRHRCPRYTPPAGHMTTERGCSWLWHSVFLKRLTTVPRARLPQTTRNHQSLQIVASKKKITTELLLLFYSKHSVKYMFYVIATHP